MVKRNPTVARKQKSKTEEKKTLFQTEGDYAYIPETHKKFSVDINQVFLDKMNPRKNDKAAKQLAELIRIHGFRQPIVVDDNGIIRAGNTRYKAAKLLGMSKIPAVKNTFKSEAAAIAFGISDNKSTEFSEWNEAILKDLMDSDEVRAFTGFSASEQARILRRADPDLVEKVNATVSKEKGNIIVLVMDIEKVDTIRTMLEKWIKNNKIKDVEIN